MPGQQNRLVRRTTFGTEAIYRVIAEANGLVELEVISAPGLEPGMRMNVTQQAVEAMERLAPVRAAAPLIVKFSHAPEPQ